MGVLTLNNTLVTGNSSTGNDGGGIFNNEGSVHIVGSTITDNEADGNGGGIATFGEEVIFTLTLTDSMVSGNTAVGNGGGIFSEGDTVELTRTTVSGNTAGESGGGIFSFFSTTSIDDSTILVTRRSPNSRSTSVSRRTAAAGSMSSAGRPRFRTARSAVTTLRPWEAVSSTCSARSP